MGRLLPFLVLADIALIVVALFDCLTSDEDVVRGMPRIGWVLLIVLLSPVGAIMWFVSRRAEENAQALAASAPPPAPEREIPVNQLPPDDDPDFLRDLAVRAKEVAEANRAENERRRAESDKRSAAEERDKSDQAREDEERLRKWEADLRAREEKLREGQPPTAPPVED